MSDLSAAHRGYEYQDLMAACRLVDLVVGTVRRAHVDLKLVDGDRFDDLTTEEESGGRERVQFKHKDNDDQPLQLATFTKDARDLQLDKLLAAAVADRDRTDSAATSLAYRVVLRDGRPVDQQLLAVLRPADPDPGPFLHGMTSHRMRFDADALWQAAVTDPEPGKPPPFGFLRGAGSTVQRADLDWFCAHFTVEVEAPAATGDLTMPGPAEEILLRRVRLDIGAESFPNEDRAAVDVADAVVRLARAARQRRTPATRDELLRRAQLRPDFGAVGRSHPVVATVHVQRGGAVAALRQAAADATESGGTVVVTGPPGQGKSWLCQELLDELDHDGWLVAEHYCYLGDADTDRDARVLTETLFGSLLARIADGDPDAVAGQLPVLAADERKVVDAVGRALASEPNRPVALVVDGLDHVTRVRPQRPGSDPSLVLAEALAALDLPAGSVLVVLSQMGGHLAPLTAKAQWNVAVPGMSAPEIGALAATRGVVGAGAEPGSPLAGAEDQAVAAFVAALHSRSAGNALYATYLCRELLRTAGPVDPVDLINGLPHFDGTLQDYYSHLFDMSLEQQSWWVAEVIAMCDFALTAVELREIDPRNAHRVEAALAALAPVLADRSTQGKIRIFHESFGRFLRQRLQADEALRTATAASVAAWLDDKGLFEDARAFRCLLPLLATAGDHDAIVARVDVDFVVRAVAAGQPVSAIQAALATGASSAGRVGDWPAAVRCVELSRAASTLQDERYESTLVAFADVVAALVGSESLAEHLLHDGRTVMPARAGLQMCAAIDQLGAVPPWREYLSAHSVEGHADNTHYGEASDRAVDLAILRGRLRLSAAESGPGPADEVAGDDAGDVADVAGPVDWEALVAYCDDSEEVAPAVMRIVADTYGYDAAGAFVSRLTKRGRCCLALAEMLAVDGSASGGCSPRTWVWAAVAHGLPGGSVRRLTAAGLGPGDVLDAVAYDLDELLAETRAVQESSVRWEGGVLTRWLDQCCVAAFADPVALDAVEGLIDGAGWYPCWLRFAVGLARAEAGPIADRDEAVCVALDLLTEDLNPFTGDPRACDLYAIHDVIQATVRQALGLLSEQVWERAARTIRRVSQAVASTLSGELGGPLPADWTASLIVKTAPASKLEVARGLAYEDIEDGAAGRFYSDITETRLVAARLELAGGDVEQARSLWLAACALLVGYGWHKDITIYELLDPFPDLIDVDPRRARQRLPQVQQLCERARQHTDGKETNHAPARWWELLAAADPAALARLVTPALLSECNDPNSHLHSALAEMWRICGPQVDPFLSAALRLTLDIGLDPGDADTAGRLAQSTTSALEPAGRLLSVLMARLDERPYRHDVSNDADLRHADDSRVRDVNAAVEGSPAPFAAALPAVDLPAAPREGHAGPSGRPSPPDIVARQTAPTAPMPPGAAGLAAAVRSWQSRGYDDPAGSWATDRVANQFGYRLLELAEVGEGDAAGHLLRQISEGVSFGDGVDLLAALADGLARHGQTALAATANALVWTRTRGHGGWLTFGGKTAVDRLQAATAANAELALSVVADEIEQVIRRGRVGTWGVSQALVYAFAVGALQPSNRNPVEVAFGCFDAATTVVAARLPRVHDHDDPDLPYEAPDPDNGQPTPGDLDAAAAIAAFGGLAHPEREAKRRALLAVEFLAAARPAVSADAVQIALTHTSDPATLTWLLRLLKNSVLPASPALAASAAALDVLAADPRLTVRSTARSLAGSRPDLPPPDPADVELLGASGGLWTPASNDPQPRFADGLVADVAGARLAEAEASLPGLTAAVRRRTAEALEGQAVADRMRRQLRALADRTESDWPDAYLAAYEVVEDALQRAAGGVRAADLHHGRLRGAPTLREGNLVEVIADEPHLPVAFEGRRRPRPELAVPPHGADGSSGALQGDGSAPAQAGAGASAAGTQPAAGTVAAVVVDGFGSLDDAGNGWRILGSVERLLPARRLFRDDQPVVVSSRYRGVEARAEGDITGWDLPPFSEGDLRSWSDWKSAGRSVRQPQPLTAVDVRLVAVGDAATGLGLPEMIMTPSGLPSLLGLKAGDVPFVLDDQDGPALALVSWRTRYETSDYYQPRPRLTGNAIVIREGAFMRLASFVPRLVIRDYVSRRELAD